MWGRGGGGLECFSPLREAAKRRKKRQITVRKMPRKNKKRAQVSGFNQKRQIRTQSALRSFSAGTFEDKNTDLINVEPVRSKISI